MLYVKHARIQHTFLMICMLSRVASAKGHIASEHRLRERGGAATSTNGRFACERPCGERGRCAAASAPEVRHALR